MSRIYQTTDYRRVIVTELEARRLPRKGLAQALGNSEAWLSLMLKGRPLKPELADPVSAFFGFDADQTRYFAALVDLEDNSPRTRDRAWATVQAVQRHRSSAERYTEDVAATFASWHVQAIGELARCEGFRPDPAWIAPRLQPPITVEQAEEALILLVRIGILVPDDQGGLRASGEDTWSPTELPQGPISRAVAQFHTDAMELAKQALRGANYNERHHSSIQFAIPEDHYAAVVGALHELERHLALVAQQGQGTPNRVYMLGLQLFPISLYTDSEPVEPPAPPTNAENPQSEPGDAP